MYTHTYDTHFGAGVEAGVDAAAQRPSKRGLPGTTAIADGDLGVMRGCLGLGDRTPRQRDCRKMMHGLWPSGLQIQKQAMAEELVFSSVYSKSEYVNWRNTIFIHE
jgi:hypothetical protein